MVELDVGLLVIMENGKMVGMLIFCEVFVVFKQYVLSLVGVMVGEVMVKDLVIVFFDMEVNDLCCLMIEKYLCYLLVFDGDMLMGVIFFFDVVKVVFEEQSFENKMLKSYIKNWLDEVQV